MNEQTTNQKKYYVLEQAWLDLVHPWDYDNFDYQNSNGTDEWIRIYENKEEAIAELKKNQPEILHEVGKNVYHYMYIEEVVPEEEHSIEYFEDHIEELWSDESTKYMIPCEMTDDHELKVYDVIVKN